MCQSIEEKSHRKLEWVGKIIEKILHLQDVTQVASLARDF